MATPNNKPHGDIVTRVAFELARQGQMADASAWTTAAKSAVRNANSAGSLGDQFLYAKVEIKVTTEILRVAIQHRLSMRLVANGRQNMRSAADFNQTLEPRPCFHPKRVNKHML